MLSNLASFVKREIGARAGPLAQLDDKAEKMVRKVSDKIDELEDLATRASPDALVAYVEAWAKELEHSSAEESVRFIDDREGASTGELLTFKDVFLASHCLEKLVLRLVNAAEPDRSVFSAPVFASKRLPALFAASCHGDFDLHVGFAHSLHEVGSQMRGRELRRIMNQAILDIIRSLKLHPEAVRFSQQLHDLSSKTRSIATCINAPSAVFAVGTSEGASSGEASAVATKAAAESTGETDAAALVGETSVDGGFVEASLGAPVATTTAVTATVSEATAATSATTSLPAAVDDGLGLATLVATGKNVGKALDLCQERRRIKGLYVSCAAPDLPRVKQVYDNIARHMDTIGVKLTENKRSGVTQMELCKRLRECAIRDRDESLTELEKLEQLVLKEEHRLADHIQDLRQQMRLTKTAVVELEKNRRQLEEDRLLTARKYDLQLRKLVTMEGALGAWLGAHDHDHASVKSMSELTEKVRPALYDAADRVEKGIVDGASGAGSVLAGPTVAVAEGQSCASTEATARANLEWLEEYVTLGEWFMDNATKSIEAAVCKVDASGGGACVSAGVVTELQTMCVALGTKLDTYLERYGDDSEATDVLSTRVAAAHQAFEASIVLLKAAAPG